VISRVSEVGVPTKVPYVIGLRELVVLRTARMSPSMIRVTLGGPDIEGFSSHVAEEHVRLIFPDEHGVLRLPERNGRGLTWPRPLPVSREYTVRRHDAGELDIDIAVHASGIGSDWAERVQPGERIPVAGPPGGRAVPQDYDRYLFAGDLTAQPQIARYLERLPADAVGHAFVEVTGPEEEIPMSAPGGIAVTWVHRGAVVAEESDALGRALRVVPPRADGERLLAWAAAEAGVLKTIRGWLRDELGTEKQHTVVTGYWKRGVADYDDD